MLDVIHEAFDIDVLQIWRGTDDGNVIPHALLDTIHSVKSLLKGRACAEDLLAEYAKILDGVDFLRHFRRLRLELSSELLVRCISHPTIYR